MVNYVQALISFLKFLLKIHSPSLVMLGMCECDECIVRKVMER